MSAKVINLEQARARRPCRRADGSRPALRRPPSDALSEALAALDRCGDDEGFHARLETFRKAFEAAKKRGTST